jgi:enediyne polyketide synthase
MRMLKAGMTSLSFLLIVYINLLKTFLVFFMKMKTPPVPVAVIGLSCWYPDARNPRQLWENILARRRQFRLFPDQRLPLSDYYHPDPEEPDKTYGRKVAVIDGFDFDWASRRITLSTYEATDIAHWLALEVALEAITDAGFDRENIPREHTGVIVGNTLTGEQSRANSMRLRWPFVRRALNAAAQFAGLSSGQLAETENRLELLYKSVFPVR